MQQAGVLAGWSSLSQGGDSLLKVLLPLTLHMLSESTAWKQSTHSRMASAWSPSSWACLQQCMGQHMS
jgi:hypothetical protein